MTKRRRRKKQNQVSWFSFGASLRKKRKPTKAGKAVTAARNRIIFYVLAIACVLGAIGAGFFYLEKYVKAVSPVAAKFGPIELISPPDWINSELTERISSIAGGRDFSLDESTAKIIALNLQSLSWLYDVTVQTTDKTIRVKAEYRKPVTMVKVSREQYYIDEEMVVLDYLPISKLPIVEIKGISAKNIPSPGRVWLEDGIAAAVVLLKKLAEMDAGISSQKPLLYEIATIDVSNLGGRKSTGKPHIILNAKDGTQIFWGAAYGESARYLEAIEKEKIISLYNFYKEHGTIQLQGKIKYIDLRPPQNIMPRLSEN